VNVGITGAEGQSVDFYWDARDRYWASEGPVWAFMKAGDALDRLRAAQADGLIRYIGFSSEGSP
jgi:hypothetical protein